MIGSQRRHSNARGFTLIELLIVMGIILILVSMLIVGAKYISNTGRVHATKAALESARALFTEYETQTHLTHQPPTMNVQGSLVICKAIANWSPQSQRKEPNMSPVRQDECTRTNTASSSFPWPCRCVAVRKSTGIGLHLLRSREMQRLRRFKKTKVWMD